MDTYAHGCSSVDDSLHADAYVECLNLMLAHPYFQQYKQTSFDLLDLHPGDSVLEVGCGTGDDAATLAERVGEGGRVVAIDKSDHMLAYARSRLDSHLPIEWLQADVQALPFDDDLFDGARVDRTLQHVPDPAQAIVEMTRVVRPGGRVVAFDPDWETLTLDTADFTLTRRLLHHWTDSFQSGRIGVQMYRLFREAGLQDVTVHPCPLILTDFNMADPIFHLTGQARRAEDQGIITTAEADAWLADLNERAANGTFFSAFMAYLMVGYRVESGGA